MTEDPVLEEMMGKLGSKFGRYQLCQFMLQMVAAVTSGLHMMSLVTVAAVPRHRCFIDGVDTDMHPAGWKVANITNAIPLDQDGGMESCLMFNDNGTAVKCSKWVYSKEYIKTSRTIQWDLVCDRLWMGRLAQTAFMLGVLVGAVVLGRQSDIYGRKIIYCTSGVLSVVFGVGVAFIPKYEPFLAMRFVYGILGSAGSYLPGFTLAMEMVTPELRTTCGMIFQAGFPTGIKCGGYVCGMLLYKLIAQPGMMLVAGWGALISDCQLLQVVYGLHGCIFIIHCFLLDESPRWLWSKGRGAEAVKIVQRGIRFNGIETSFDAEQFITKSHVATGRETKKLGYIDLFRTPNIRKRSLIICFCLFANSFVYYGLSLNTYKLGGNLYLVFFLMALMELPSYLLIILCQGRIGRRAMISTLMFLSGLCCIASAYCVEESAWPTVFSMLGKFLISGSFSIGYNYAAELFPTGLRNSALAMGSTASRISGASAPMISLLDSVDKHLPPLMFGVLSLVACSLTLFLPETDGVPLPQTLEDGENFRTDDTVFTGHCGCLVKCCKCCQSDNTDDVS